VPISGPPRRCVKRQKNNCDFPLLHPAAIGVRARRRYRLLQWGKLPPYRCFRTNFPNSNRGAKRVGMRPEYSASNLSSVNNSSSVNYLSSVNCSVIRIYPVRRKKVEHSSLVIIGARTSTKEKMQFRWEFGGKFGWISELITQKDTYGHVKYCPSVSQKPNE